MQYTYIRMWKVLKKPNVDKTITREDKQAEWAVHYLKIKQRGSTFWQQGGI